MMIGHLHLLFNALEEACKALDVSDRFFFNLRCICNFLGDIQWRRRFQQVCVNGKACCHKFNSCPRHHIDWRWEFLSPAIDSVMAVFEDMRTYFSPEALLTTETGTLSDRTVREVAEALKDDTFSVLVDMFRMFVGLIERYASRLEGCHCHASIWKEKRKHSARVNAVQASTGTRHCVWKGRQGSWWVA